MVAFWGSRLRGRILRKRTDIVADEGKGAGKPGLNTRDGRCHLDR